MRQFIDPVQLAVLRKLQLESRGDYQGRVYKGDDYWRQHFGNNIVLLKHLKDLESHGFIKLTLFRIGPEYIQLREHQVPIGSGGSYSYKRDPYLGFGRNLYTKMKQGLELDWVEVQEIYGTLRSPAQDSFFPFLTFKLEFPDRAKKMAAFLREYLRLFIEGDIVAEGMNRFYSYKIQRQGVLKAIGRLSSLHGVKNLTLNTADIWIEPTISYNQTNHNAYLAQTRFLETVLSLELEGLIKVEEVLNMGSIRLSIRQVTDVSEADEWTKDFYNIASHLSSFSYIMRRRRNGKVDSTAIAKELSWNSLKLDLNSGWAEYNGTKHMFRPSRDPYKILKLLLEANGEPVNYDRFFTVVNPDFAKDVKNGKDYIRQNIRDIRKALKINRLKDRETDIFYDTGDGFRLMKIP